MNSLRDYLKQPYLYILFFSFYGVWLGWDAIRIPYHDPAGVISYLPSIGYNPTNNLLRFLVAVLLPPLACLVYWAITQTSWKKLLKDRRLVVIVSSLLIVGAILLTSAMAIVQQSTSVVNNQTGAFGGPYSHALLDTFHEGETLGPAVSYQQKNLKPYRDFVIIHGVFQDPLRTVIAFKLFGKSIGASRAFAVILLMITFALFYLLLLILFSWDIIKSTLGIVLLALLLNPAATVPGSGHLFIGILFPFRDIATILFLAFAVLGFRSTFKNRAWPTRLWGLLIGFLAVIGFGNSIDRAMYIVVLSVIWLVMLLFLSKKEALMNALLPMVIGGLLAVPVLGLAIKWAFLDFWRYLFTMSRYKEYLDGIVFTRPGAAVSIILVVLSVVIFATGAWIIQIYSKLPSSKRNWRNLWAGFEKPFTDKIKQYHTEILLFITGGVFLRSAIGRALNDHFAYSCQWIYLFLIFIGINYLWKRLSGYQVLLGLITVLLFGATGIHYGVQVKRINLRNDTFPIHVSDKDLVRADYQQTASYLKQNLTGNKQFVTLTSEGAWYYLVNKPSPIPYYVVWYAYTQAQRQSIAANLANNVNITYVVTNNNWTSDFDFVPNPARFPEVYKVLYDKFVPQTGFGQQTIWVRK